jgi:hypothetical protein
MSSQIFQHYLSFCWRLVAKIRHLLALKCECHAKTTVLLKECSPKASKTISSVLAVDLPSSTQDKMQKRCLILPSIADKTKHEVEKALE